VAVSTFAGAAASIGGMADVIKATESPSLKKQPRAARSAAGRNLFTLIVYPFLRTSAMAGSSRKNGQRAAALCHILTLERAILRVKGSVPSLLEAESLPPIRPFFFSVDDFQIVRACNRAGS
jgi:hypothetical protein